MGRVVCKSLYVFIRQMARSTCILTLDNLLRSSTSRCDSCCFPIVYGGIANVAPWRASSSAISKKRSASTWSPLINRFRNPLWTLSDTLLPQHFEINVITPVGLIAIKILQYYAFIVWVCFRYSWQWCWSLNKDLWAVCNTFYTLVFRLETAW